MTIETQASKVRYVGDGTAAVFPVPFPVRQAEHLRLYLASALGVDVEFDAEYSVSGLDSDEVSVTLSAPLPSGENLAIVRLVPLAQQMDLENGGNFDAETIERQFDITEMQIQQIQEQVDRAIKVPVTSEVTPTEFWKELLDASKAALEVYQRMLELADTQALGAHAVNVRRSGVALETVPAGNVLTLPVWYYPKRNILYLAVDGMVCTPRLPDNADQSERQYEEVGDDPNTLSNQVRVHFPVEAGMVVDAWVVASNQSGDEAAQNAEAAAASAALARQWAANPEGDPVTDGQYSALHWAQKAEAAALAGGVYGEASPTNLGLAPAGGTAGQVYQVSADGQSYGWGNPSGIPLLIPMAVPFSTVMPGFLSVCRDNGRLTAGAFPDAARQLATLKAAGETNIVSLAAWESEFAAQNGVCGRFALSDDGQSFRIPCMPAQYWRGMSQTAGLGVGMWQPDQMQGHWHNVSAITNALGLIQVPATSGFAINYSSNTGSPISDGVNGTPRVGSETRPTTVVVDYQMKLYGAATDAGSVTLAQLIAAMAGKLDTSRYESDNTLSVTEAATGEKWIDGKKIYRKVIDCGALPNTTGGSKLVPTGVADLETMISISCTGAGDGIDFVFPIPFPGVQDILYMASQKALRISAYRAGDAVYNKTRAIILYTRTGG